MARDRAKGHWRRVARYIITAVLCLVAVMAMWAAGPWYWRLIGACAALGLALGRRRIFRPAVTRTANEIVCRYSPWYEGNVYFLNILLPLMGVAMVAAGCDPGNPVWLRFGGIILLVLTPLFIFSAVRMWRRCVLRISPSMLTVRLGTIGAQLTEIPREQVRSIEPKLVPSGFGGEWLQVEIAYHTADLSGDTTKTVLVGLGVTVEPVNLVKALVTWNQAANENPSALLDRIEGILRGRSTAGV